METEAVRMLRRHLRTIERTVERQLKNQTVCCGVTSAQCHALLELEEAGEASLVELSERLKLDTSTLSRTMDGLVRSDFVDRVIDPRNRRYVLLGLTPKGKRKVDTINKACDRFYVDFLGRLSASRWSQLIESAELLAGILARSGDGGARATVGAGNDKAGRKNARG